MVRTPRPYNWPPPTRGSRLPRGLRDLKGFVVGILYLVLVNLPIAAFGLAFVFDFGSVGFAALVIAVSIPPMVLFFNEARWLGGRYWLVAIFLSTFPSLAIVPATALIVEVTFDSIGADFAPWDPLLTPILIIHVAVALLSLMGAVFYGPLSRWVEHRRDR